MTKRPEHPARKQSILTGSPHHPRRKAEVYYANDFEHSLRKMGDPTVAMDEIWVFQQTREFASEWKSGVFDQELRRTWGYKSLTCPRPNREKLVWQISIGHYRVMLTVLEGDAPALWFLEAFRKSPTTQSELLRRACQRARELQRRAR
jgi:hypothetical protein